jgi:hypothetical protein
MAWMPSCELPAKRMTASVIFETCGAPLPFETVGVDVVDSLMFLNCCAAEECLLIVRAPFCGSFRPLQDGPKLQPEDYQPYIRMSNVELDSQLAENSQVA